MSLPWLEPNELRGAPGVWPESVAPPSRRWTVTVAGVCFVLGFLVASIRWGGALGDQLNRFVLNATTAYSALYEVARTTPPGTSEYLVFLNRGVDAPTYMAFIEGHPDIEYLSESIYPNAIRVALKIPVRDTLKDLEAQPFARFVIRNYPFLFCH